MALLEQINTHVQDNVLQDQSKESASYAVSVLSSGPFTKAWGFVVLKVFSPSFCVLGFVVGSSVFR